MIASLYRVCCVSFETFCKNLQFLCKILIINGSAYYFLAYLYTCNQLVIININQNRVSYENRVCK